MSPALVRVAQRDERIGTVAQSLADADEDPGRERHPRAPGIIDDLQAQRGVFVGGAVVHLPGLFIQAP